MPVSTDKELFVPNFKSMRALDRYRNLCLWLPVTVASKKLPWGYYQDPSNPRMALPDEKALKVFIKGRQYLKEHSYAIVAEWFSGCGFPIGGYGIIKGLRNRPYWPEIELPYEERLKL